jgi:hypothetical protein
VGGRRKGWVGHGLWSVGETERVRAAEPEELISIRGEVDVRGTVKNRLLTSPFPPPTRTTTLADAFFVHVPHGLWAIVEELQFDFGIELGHQEGEKSDGTLAVPGSGLFQPVRMANLPQLEEI